MNWQPIETAPKDGTLVILYDPSEEAVCVGVFDFNLWHCADEHQPENGEFGLEGFISGLPTHWMPLPSPPDLLNKQNEAENDAEQ